jgi:hypothetical protein
LKANTPAVYGKLPGTFSRNSHDRISPSSRQRGSATFGMRVPDSEVSASGVRTSLSRMRTTYSSPA